tara:strand:+ start:50733 stop:51632 length:900 start_codon:yes stop_codon:yes gene_type:complete
VVKLPDGVNVNNLIDDLRILSWEAADILLHYSHVIKEYDFKNELIKNKDENNPVTIADLEVNDLVLNSIKYKYPNFGWKYLSEENVKLEKYCDLNSEWVWVLDPLDGTKDFIQGTGNYAMHLALMYKKKPILGVVLIPSKDELWMACGSKIWSERRKDRIKEINSFSKKNLREMTLATSKNHSNPTLGKLIDIINFQKVVVMGSIGCKISSIIRGDCDIYICLSMPGRSTPKDWDFAAPEAILKASGGAITNIDNEDLNYLNKDFSQGNIIIASNNKQSHGSICIQIKKIIKENDLLSY